MIVKVLSSGSDGNCYVLKDSAGKMLILDAGIPWKDIQIGIDFRPADVEAVCITHCHSDHARAVRNIETAGIKVLMPWQSETAHRGLYSVKPFPLTDSSGSFVHTNNDGSACPIYGFLIEHKELGRMIYLTDCEFCKWRFKRINHILVECNYDSDLINPHAPNARHVYQGHMELNTAIGFINSNASKDLRSVGICHVGGNLDPMKALDRIYAETGLVTWIAEKGTEYEFSDLNAYSDAINRFRSGASTDTRCAETGSGEPDSREQAT